MADIVYILRKSWANLIGLLTGKHIFVVTLADKFAKVLTLVCLLLALAALHFRIILLTLLFACYSVSNAMKWKSVGKH